MRFDKFLDALHEAGWRSTADAQHTGIYELWKQLFPSVYELEKSWQTVNKQCKNLLRKLKP